MIDPISHIHELDVVKAGIVVLVGVIGIDLQADCAAPTVSFTDPANGATGVALNQAIAATFDEAMDPVND